MPDATTMPVDQIATDPNAPAYTPYVPPQGAGGYYASQNDPFAYTNGSLLTPYTQQFGYPGVYGGSQSGTGGSYSAGMNPGSFVGQFTQNPWVGNDPSYWEGVIAKRGGLTPENQQYWAQRMMDPPGQGSNSGGAGGVNLQPMNPFQYAGGDFKYSPTQVSSVSAPSAMDAPSDFSYGAYTAPQAFNPAMFNYGGTPVQPTFQAPTLDNTNDPGYAFRLKEGQRAIQNQASAQGLRGGDVAKAMQDYAQNYASSEYGNVYNRALSGFNANLAGQQQQFGQDYSASALNSQNSLAAASLNDQNALSAYQTNYNVAADTKNQNFNRAFNVYNANAQNQLATAGLNQQAEIANNQFGYQAASGVYDRNYQQALNSYQMQWQQALDSAGIGLQSQQLGLQSQNQGFNQALATYNTNQGTFRQNQNDQFSRLYSMAGLGQNAAGNLSGAAGNYANNQGNLVTGQAGANAAAQVASGNAWAGFSRGLGNTVGQGLVATSPLNPYRTTGIAPSDTSWDGV